MHVEGTSGPAFPFNAAASAFLALVVPYTQFFVFPINDKLLAEHDRVKKAEKSGNRTDGPNFDSVRDWASSWKSADVVRSVLAHLAMISGAIAMLRY